MLVDESDLELQRIGMIIKTSEADEEMSDVSSEVGRPDVVYHYCPRSGDVYWDFMLLIAKASSARESWQFRASHAKCAWCSICNERVPFTMKDHSHVIEHMETYHAKHVITRLAKLEKAREKRAMKKASEARQLSLLNFFPVVSQADAKG